MGYKAIFVKKKLVEVSCQILISNLICMYFLSLYFCKAFALSPALSDLPLNRLIRIDRQFAGWSQLLSARRCRRRFVRAYSCKDLETNDRLDGYAGEIVWYLCRNDILRLKRLVEILYKSIERSKYKLFELFNVQTFESKGRALRGHPHYSIRTYGFKIET